MKKVDYHFQRFFSYYRLWGHIALLPKQGRGSIGWRQNLKDCLGCLEQVPNNTNYLCLVLEKSELKTDPVLLICDSGEATMNKHLALSAESRWSMLVNLLIKTTYYVLANWRNSLIANSRKNYNSLECWCYRRSHVGLASSLYMLSNTIAI